MAAHWAWFFHSHDLAVAQRFGASLIVIGIVVTSVPFIRSGVREAVERQIPGAPFPFYVSATIIEDEIKRRHSIRPSVLTDVLAERVIGVALIVVGTFVNGYGDLLFKWLL